MSAQKEKTALTYILLALVPYTRQNILLGFKPHQFFNELERISGYSTPTLRAAFNRAKLSNTFSIEKNHVTLSIQARQIVQPFIAEKLTSGGELMVIFDIPESLTGQRRKFRNILHYLEFQQVQQSVWSTDKDHRSVIFDSILDLDLGDYVQLYEAARIA